jgi:hypothetical protein
MAFRNVATLLAEGVALDAVTNRLSAFNMMETVFAPTFPAVLGKLVVVNLYEVDGDREPHWERVTIVDDAGTQLAQVVTEFRGEGVAHRSMGMLQGMRLEKPGIYTVLVEGAKRREGSWEFVNRRLLRAVLGPHPLARVDPKNPDSGKVTGQTVITD